MIGGAKANYEYAQRYPIDNMVRYLFTGSAMLETIDRLTQLYRTAEEMADVTTDQVQGILSNVYAERKADFEAWQAANPPRDANGNRMDL
jgi:hypothetical protein